MSRAEQKALTRATILRVAKHRFVERGYEDTTIRDIAEAAGVSVGSVHAHFRDKRALLFRCFYANIEGATSRLWSSMPEGVPLLDQLTHCAHVLFEAYAEHPALSRVMFRETLFPAADDPRDEQLDPFLAGVAGLFRAAHERGELERLPGGGRLAAQNFFAVYLAVLIGGLSGYWGDSADPRVAATGWSTQLRMMVELQLEGLGPKEVER